MIETPAAALCAAQLAEESAFFSIGTNDLVQYTLAADRGNERLRHLQNADHPAVLALIRQTCEAASAAGIPVGVCGEAAGEPEMIPKARRTRRYGVEHGRPPDTKGQEGRLRAVRARVFPDYEAISAAVAYVVAGRLEEEPSTVPHAANRHYPSRDVQAARRDAPLGEALFRERDLLQSRRIPWAGAGSTGELPRVHEGALLRAHRCRPCTGLRPRRGRPQTPEAECRRYEAAIGEAGGIDVCVLGIGRNGHIGFNEPGASFDSRTRVVELSESTRKVNAADFEADRAPERAITAGMATIFDSKSVLLLASGTNKAGAVAAAVEDDVSESLPASMLRSHPERRTFSRRSGRLGPRPRGSRLDCSAPLPTPVDAGWALQ